MLGAERECDEVTILSEGEIVGSGAPAELLARHDGCSTLEELFLSLTGLGEAQRQRKNRITAVFSASAG